MDNFDYRGTWGRAASNVLNSLAPKGFNSAEFWVGSWQDGTAVSDGESITYKGYNKMSYSSLAFGRQINEIFGTELIGEQESDLTMTISWSRPVEPPVR